MSCNPNTELPTGLARRQRRHHHTIETLHPPSQSRSSRNSVPGATPDSISRSRARVAGKFGGYCTWHRNPAATSPITVERTLDPLVDDRAKLLFELSLGEESGPVARAPYGRPDWQGRDVCLRCGSLLVAGMGHRLPESAWTTRDSYMEQTSNKWAPMSRFSVREIVSDNAPFT